MKCFIKGLLVIVTCENTVAKRTFQENESEQTISHFFINLITIKNERFEHIYEEEDFMNIPYRHDRFEHIYCHGIWWCCG